MDLVKSISIDNLLNQRAAVIDRFRQAQALLAEAEQMLAAAGIMGKYNNFQTLLMGDWRISTIDLLNGEKGLQQIIQRIDAWAWDKLLHDSGLRTFMHAEARESWDRQIQELKCPPLTHETIAETFRALHASRGQMMEDGVVAVFKKLSWHYKTNLPQRFGKRLVITHLVCPNGTPSYSGRACNSLDDLVRVFCVLDGKPEPDHRQGMYSQISDALEGKPEQDHRVSMYCQISDNRHNRFLDHEYFTLKWFKNGNGHLTFKRPDLVDELNAIITRRFPGALYHDRQKGAA